MRLLNSLIEKVKSKLPELPLEKKSRFIQNYNLSDYDAELLTSSKYIAQYFENTINNTNIENEDYKQRFAKEIANWVNGEIFRYLKENGYNVNYQENII